MLPWRKRKPERKPLPSREALLRAVPLKNTLLRETPTPNGLRLTGQVNSSWRRLLGAKPEKTFELDSLGAAVWNSLDGRRTVEDLIRHFAADKRVNLREAEVAVLAFLRTLLRRGLVALAADPPPAQAPANTPAPRRRRG